MSENAELFPVVADAIGAWRSCACCGRRSTIARRRSAEQWDDGSNFFAVAPGVDLRLRAQRDDEHLPAKDGELRGRHASRRSNSAAAAAGHGACPVRSNAMLCTKRIPGPPGPDE